MKRMKLLKANHQGIAICLESWKRCSGSRSTAIFTVAQVATPAFSRIPCLMFRFFLCLLHVDFYIRSIKQLQ